MCTYIKWILAYASIFVFLANLYRGVVLLPEQLIESHRGYTNSGNDIVLTPTNTSRILTTGLVLPDYWHVKSFSLLFYAHMSKANFVPGFTLECHDGYTTTLRSPLGRPSTFTYTNTMYYRRTRIPTQVGYSNSVCFIVVSVASSLPDDDNHRDEKHMIISDWHIQITPRWHWTDWLSRSVTNEYYRAQSIMGLNYGQFAEPDTWYGGMGLDIDDPDPEELDEESIIFHRTRRTLLVVNSIYDPTRNEKNYKKVL